MADPSSRPTGLLFPTESLGAFRLTFTGDAGAYADQSGEVVARWSSKWDRAELWLFDLHHHLWMGEPGATAGGILGLIGIGFTITGLLLWWRARRSFRPRLLPEGMSRSQIVRHHRDIGTLTSPLLIVTLLTGSLLDAAARRRLPVLHRCRRPARSPNRWRRRRPKAARWLRTSTGARRCRTVQRMYPEAELRGISVPTAEGGLIRIRARQPHEWLPNGRTIFWFDPADGRLVDVVDAQSLPLATKAFNLVYPIHASTVGGFIYKAAMTAAGLALTLLGTLAVYGFWRHRVRRTVPGRVSAEAPVSLPDYMTTRLHPVHDSVTDPPSRCERLRRATSRGRRQRRHLSHHAAAAGPGAPRGGARRAAARRVRAISRGRSGRAYEARSDDQARHPVRDCQQLPEHAGLHAGRRIHAASRCRSSRARASRAGEPGLRPADSRCVSALVGHEGFLGSDAAVAARIRRRPGAGLATQSRLRCRPDVVRPAHRRSGADAGRLRRDVAPLVSQLLRRRPAARERRDLLRRAMEREGFSVYDTEWWHFDFNQWREYPIVNRDFAGLK